MTPGDEVLPSLYSTKFSLLLGSGQMQQSKTEKLMTPPIHTASTTEKQPWHHGQELKETLVASSVNSNNIVPNGLEIQLLERRNEYFLYFQSFVSVLNFSTSLKQPLHHVSAKPFTHSVKAPTVIYVHIGYNDDSVVKSSGWSSRGLRFYSQHPYASSQVSVALVLRVLIL